MDCAISQDNEDEVNFIIILRLFLYDLSEATQGVCEVSRTLHRGPFESFYVVNKHALGAIHFGVGYVVFWHSVQIPASGVAIVFFLVFQVPRLSSKTHKMELSIESVLFETGTDLKNSFLIFIHFPCELFTLSIILPVM